METRDKETLYQKLGVAPSATPEEIHRAYAALTEELLSLADAPQPGETHVTEDEGLFRELTKAYRTLIDDESRKAYDETLRHVGPLPVFEGTAAEPVHQTVARYREVVLPKQAPDEAWLKEREYFEEHFEEILKPAPKVNLVSDSTIGRADEPMTTGAAVLRAGSTTGAEQREDGSVKFGTFPSENELEMLVSVKHPRRPASSGGFDVFDLLLFFGMPLMALLLIVEYIVLFQ